LQSDIHSDPGYTMRKKPKDTGTVTAVNAEISKESQDETHAQAPPDRCEILSTKNYPGSHAKVRASNNAKN
jgi:hypothetical protein